MPGVSLHPGGPARLGPHGARVPLPTPPRRTRNRARDRGDRLQLDRAARAARRCLRGRTGCGRGSLVRRRPLERDGGAAPCPRRPRDRAGRRGRVLGLHLRSVRQPDHLHGSRPRVRRRGLRDVDDRPGAPRPRDLQPARCGRSCPRGDRGRPVRPVLRLRRAPRGLRAPRGRTPPGRHRVARGDVPRRARGCAGSACRLLVQRQQDHHHERRRDARLGRSRLDRARAKARRRRRASRFRTTSTSRSGSTTA